MQSSFFIKVPYTQPPARAPAPWSLTCCSAKFFRASMQQGIVGLALSSNIKKLWVRNPLSKGVTSFHCHFPCANLASVMQTCSIRSSVLGPSPGPVVSPTLAARSEFWTPVPNFNAPTFEGPDVDHVDWLFAFDVPNLHQIIISESFCYCFYHQHMQIPHPYLPRRVQRHY